MSQSNQLLERLTCLCIEKLSALPSEDPYTTEEKTLLDRILNTQDPLQWEDRESDDKVCLNLWAKLKDQAGSQIKFCVLTNELNEVAPLSSSPPGGYI